LRRTLVFFTILFVILSCGGTRAATLTELIGIDPAIDKTISGMQGLVDQARAAAFAIEGQTNQDLENRLSQINGIVEQTVTDVRELETKTFVDVNDLVAHVNAALQARIAQISTLEQQFMGDVIKAINTAECAVDHTVNQSLQDALGHIGKLIGASEIEISPPRMYAGEQRNLCIAGFESCDISKTFKIKTPFSQTYLDIRDYLIGRLNGSRDDTPIESIVDTYQYLAELAKRVGCFEPGSAATYDEIYSGYLNNATEWRLVTSGAL
jgi:hypothetical protein